MLRLESKYRLILQTLVCILCFFATTVASPPHPNVRDGIAAGKIATPYFMKHASELHNKGICTPDFLNKTNKAENSMTASNAPVFVGEFKVLCVLVEFSDQPGQVEAEFFDSLLYSANGSTVRTYYDEISYGQLDLITVNLPSSIDWVEAPQTYSYYVNNQNGTGTYPQNTQKLCEDIIDLIDARINFSTYDNNNDGEMDCLIIASVVPSTALVASSRINTSGS